MSRPPDAGWPLSATPARSPRPRRSPAPNLTRSDLSAVWEKGWTCLFSALAALKPEDLRRTVRVAGRELSVLDAILRQFSHYAMHIGQIVFLVKHLESSHWQALSVPRKKPGKP